MGNSRHRKGHKQKLQARKERIKQDKNKVQKMQKEFIMNLIKKEQEKGMFDNIPTINPIGLEGTVIEGPTI
jgi:hypothetical protein